MQNEKKRFGKLVVNYYTDENNYYCVCDCGNKIIIAKNQLHDNSSCGCVNRFLFLSLVGALDEGNTLKANQPLEFNEGRGISFDKKKGKWRSRIVYQSKEYHLGYFTDKETALEVRKVAESNLSNDFIGWYNIFKNGKTK